MLYPCHICRHCLLVVTFSWISLHLFFFLINFSLENVDQKLSLLDLCYFIGLDLFVTENCSTYFDIYSASDSGKCFSRARPRCRGAENPNSYIFHYAMDVSLVWIMESSWFYCRLTSLKFAFYKFCFLLVLSQLAVLLHGLMENLKLLLSIFFLQANQWVSTSFIPCEATGRISSEPIKFCPLPHNFDSSIFIMFLWLIVGPFLFAAVISNCWLIDLAGNTGHDKWY